MTFKKIIVALLSIALLLCLVACGKEEAPKTTDPAATNGEGPAATTPNTPVQAVDPDATGMLYLSMDAEVMLTYDEGGLVKAAEAANEAGQELLAKCAIAEGAACDTAVAELVKAAVDASTSDLKVVLIKQAYGSVSPSDKFLEDVRVDAEAAAAGCGVVVVDVASLTESGYLPVATVEQIFKLTVGDENAKITVSEELVNGIYYVAYEDGEVTKNYTVDADTGRISYEEDEPVIDIEDTVATEPFDAGTETEPETEPYLEEEITEPVFPDDTMPVEPEVTDPKTEETVEETEATEA